MFSSKLVSLFFTSWLVVVFYKLAWKNFLATFWALCNFVPPSLSYLVISDVRDHGQNLTCDLLGYRPHSEIQGSEISEKKLKDVQDF